MGGPFRAGRRWLTDPTPGLRRRGLLALAPTLGLAFAWPSWSASPSPEPSGDGFGSVTEYLRAGYREFGLPGASLLVSHRGRVVYEEYFGDYDAETVVPIASASKWLSAAVVMSLVDDNLIDLDAQISRYLPQFVGDKADMTIRQMFSHTSGLVDFPEPWDYTISMADYADRVAREGVMRCRPGAEVRYASASMQVVGAVAEQLTGQSWNDLFLERIAKPCAMTRTVFRRSDRNRNPMLAAGASSALSDYARFLEMIRNKGLFRGRRVLSAGAVREMQRDQTGPAPLVTASNDRMGRRSRYGLGQWIDLQAPDGRTVQVSSPGAFGFRPWLNLELDLFGVIMMRREPGERLASSGFNPWTLIDLVHAAAQSPPGARPL